MERPDFFTLKNGEKAKLPFTEKEYNQRVNNLRLVMEINNLESNKGPIYIRILDENENPVIVGTSPVINYSAEISFDSIFPGKYAIQFFHDENKNQKMDFNLIGIPKEKFGSSNDVKPILGPPKFEKMLFEIYEDKKIIMKPVN